jgi:hypothetical protein
MNNVSDREAHSYSMREFSDNLVKNKKSVRKSAAAKFAMWWSAFVQNKPMPRRCSPTHPEIVKRDLTNRRRETTSYLKTKWPKMRRPQINGR